MKTKLVLVTLLVTVFACNNESSVDELETAAPKVVQQLELLDAFGQSVAVFSQGETITFALSARNTSNEEATLNFGSSHQSDFYVRDSNNPNTVIWDRNSDSVFVQVTTSINLLPFETKVYEESWNQIQLDGTVLPSGNYVAEASFVNEFDENVVVAFEVR